MSCKDTIHQLQMFEYTEPRYDSLSVAEKYNQGEQHKFYFYVPLAAIVELHISG